MFDRISWSFAVLRRSPYFSPQATHDALFVLYGIYADASAVTHHAIQKHKNITDAWNWLAQADLSTDAMSASPEPTVSWQETIRENYTHIRKLDAMIAERDMRLADKDRQLSSPRTLLLRLIKLAARYLRNTISLHRRNAP
jgi:hypothetical protein